MMLLYCAGTKKQKLVLVGLSVFINMALNACTGHHSSLTVAATPTVSVKQSLRSNERAEWRKHLAWNEACEQAFRRTHASGYSGIETHTLGNADQLVIVMCAVGSYQPSFLLYRLKNHLPTALALATYTTTDGQALHASQQAELWGDPVFLRETGELVILNVARQTKDCGTWAKYNVSSVVPTLQALYSKLPCPAAIASPAEPDSGSPPDGWTPVNSAQLLNALY